MKIILTRHGETVENINKIVCGQLPGKLSELGIKQAKLLAKRLKGTKIDHIYSSDLTRASDTTKEIIKYHPKSDVFYVVDLREKNQGEFQGKKNSEVATDVWIKKEKNNPLNIAPKGGESKIQVYRRVKKFYNKIFSKYDSETILIVAHGGVLRSLFCLIQNIPAKEMINLKPFKHTSVTIFDINKDKSYKLHSINCTEHIE